VADELVAELGQKGAQRVPHLFPHHLVLCNDAFAASVWCRCRVTRHLLGLQPLSPLQNELASEQELIRSCQTSRASECLV
jgi:hypothetical protein